eukprot:jgi/Tetstr1/443332/TSEL_031347.t1
MPPSKRPSIGAALVDLLGVKAVYELPIAKTCEHMLSAAEDAEVKVGGPLTPARLCAFNNTYREAVQGMNVYTCLEDVEDSTDESYEARCMCH